MGQRELLLTIGAIVLFSITTRRVNQATLRNSEAIYAQQAEFYAFSLAQRFIEEGKTKAFDENTITGTPGSMPSGFTSTPMGPGGGESYPNFDDVDDFHGYSASVATAIDSMTVTISVDYVEDSNFDTIVNPTKTFYKKMTVTVNSDYLTNTVTDEYVFAFHKNP